MIAATVTQQFQLTIPSWLRKKMNIKAGDKIVFSPSSDDVAMLSIQRKNGIEATAGVFAKNKKQHPQPLTKSDIEHVWLDRYSSAHTKGQK